MTSPKSSRLKPDEEKTLASLYYEAKIPRDQYQFRQNDLLELTESWNSATARSDSAEELLQLIITRCKRPKGRPNRLEAIGEDRQRLRSPGTHALTRDEKAVLIQVYHDLGYASDEYVVNHELASRLVEEFFQKTGTYFSAKLLVATLVFLRKEGILGKLDRHSDDEDDDTDIGFRDIDQVG